MVNRWQVTKLGRKTLNHLPSVTFTSKNAIVFNVSARDEYNLREYEGIKVSIDEENNQIVLDLICCFDNVFASLGYRKLTSNKRVNPAASITKDLLKTINKKISPYRTLEFFVSLKYFLKKHEDSEEGALKLVADLGKVFEVLVPRRKY